MCVCVCVCVVFYNLKIDNISIKTISTHCKLIHIYYGCINVLSLYHVEAMVFNISTFKHH